MRAEAPTGRGIQAQQNECDESRDGAGWRTFRHLDVRPRDIPVKHALPVPFQRLALSNLAALSAEQIGLAVTPLFAVLTLGASAGQTGFLQTAQTLPFLLRRASAGRGGRDDRRRALWDRGVRMGGRGRLRDPGGRDRAVRRVAAHAASGGIAGGVGAGDGTGAPRGRPAHAHAALRSRRRFASARVLQCEPHARR